MSELYDADVYEWAQQQAALLRRRAAGELVNEAELDWPNIAEEIEDLGRSEVRACCSLFALAIAHELKARTWPDTIYVEKWLREARGYHRRARKQYRPSMKLQMEIEDIYEEALGLVPDQVDGIPAPPLPLDCPVTLDTLLSTQAETLGGLDAQP